MLSVSASCNKQRSAAAAHTDMYSAGTNLCMRPVINGIALDVRFIYEVKQKRKGVEGDEGKRELLGVFATRQKTHSFANALTHEDDVSRILLYTFRKILKDLGREETKPLRYFKQKNHHTVSALLSSIFLCRIFF